VLLDKKATVVRNIDFFPKPTNFMEEEIKKFIEPNKWKDQNKKTFKVNERIISIISTNISDKDINNFTPTLKLILKKYNRLAPAYDSNITNKKREAENQNQIISNIFAKLRKFISINKKIKDDNSKSSNHSNNSNDGANIDELAMEFQNKYLMNANEDNKTALIKSQFQLLISQQSNLFQKQNILDREELVKILEAFGNTTLIDLSNDSSPNNRTKPLENFISNYQALDDLVKRVDDIPVKEGLNLFKEDLEEYSNAFMGVKQHLEAKPLRKNNSHNNEDLIEELIEHFSENQYSQADNSQIGFKFKKYNLFVKDRITKLIKHWSKVFGLQCSTEKHIPADSAFDLSLIHEELKETYQAAAEGNLKEYQDGLGDTLWTTIRAMLNAGIDPQKTIEAIYKSNMSKSCISIEEAEESVVHYLQQGIGAYFIEYEGYYLIKRSSDNKILKSINFREPNF
jgi:NTP pyrophosphatase (non-canonical NTP hydrolase)